MGQSAKRVFPKPSNKVKIEPSTIPQESTKKVKKGLSNKELLDEIEALLKGIKADVKKFTGTKRS